MLWFNTEKKKKMDFIQTFTPKSKAQLIQVAMWYHKGDVQKAQEMVDFYTKNLDLPDFDPVEPTFFQQMKGSVSELYSWVKENQNDIAQGYQLISSLIKNKGIAPTTEVETPLPPINE